MTAGGDTPPFSCGPDVAQRGYAFCNQRLPVQRRAADLVARLTLAEKVSQLGDKAEAVPRLGVPAYKWALYNLGQAEGLTIWSPNVNIYRDPRWGRGQETPGEDPTTASKYAVAFVRGMQGTSTTTLQTSACCKHATAYDLDDWKGAVRYIFDASVTPQDLADTFNPPFKSCVVEGKATCVMCAYTSVNGVPTCADPDLLTKTIKGEWGMNGYVASDCDAVALIRGGHHYSRTDEDAVAAALKAGMDMDCGNYTQVHSMGALQQGKMTEQDVDKALKNLFAVRMRLGNFNGDPRKSPLYGRLGAGDVCSPAHRSLALEAAQDGIVLLKNDAGILPLNRWTVGSVAVIGPNADDRGALIGNYFGPPCEFSTPLQGLSGYVKNIRFEPGCNSTSCDFGKTDQAIAAARSSDHVILFMGLSQKQEQEGLDRTSLLLPWKQQSLITAVASAAKRPVILAGGLAIANVLFGEHNPSGRLPVTWYPEEFTRVNMTDMRMRAHPATGYPGRTYRFYKGETVYKFGYGLSYSKFSRRLLVPNQAVPNTHLLAGLATTADDGGASYYDVKEIGAEGCEQLKFPAVVEVQNHGPLSGKHSVLMFLRWPNATGGRPVSQLVGFRSQHLEAGEKSSLRFEVSPCEHFSRAREDGKKVVDRGSHFLFVDKEDESEISFDS
ncbi:unnamed protein product [Alopecurus aequalis]